MARGLKQSGEAVHIVHIVVDGRAGEPHDKSLYVTLPDERQEDPSSSRSALRSIKEQFESRYKGDIGILDAVKPIDDEIVMGRPTANPFFDTTLAQGQSALKHKAASIIDCSPLDLRALKAEHLVVCGVATSGIVLASVQGANERGMAVTVAEDGCMDFGEMHTHVMQ
jgi:nicotinamidase-related amidase